MKNILIILCTALSLTATAQHEGMGNFFPDITHVLGGTVQKFNGLNSRIANLPQYKQLPNYTAMLELGWFKEHGRLISTGGIMAGSSIGADHDKRSSTIRFVGIHADAGFDLLQSSRVILYPLVGIGVEKDQARFFRDISSESFNDVASSPTAQNNIHSLDLTNAFVTYRLGFGVAFKHPKYPSSTIGLQAGYNGSFSSNAWKSNQNQSLAGAPEDKISRFYFGLVLTGRPGMNMMMKGK